MSKSWQAVERTVLGEKAECEYRRFVLVADVHTSGASERLQLTHVANRHRHIAFGAADGEVVLVAVFSRLTRQVELDTSEGKLERDAAVVDGTLALYW